MANDNRELARFSMVEIPPAPRGVPQIEVGFDLDANGILKVTAKDLGTGKEQKITVEAANSLADADIERMVKDAEIHKEEDKKRREASEARNELDSMIFTIEKALKEHGDKVGSEKDEVEKELAAAKTKLDSGDSEAIKAAKSSLEAKWHKIAETIYKASASASEGATQGAPEAEGSSGAKDPNVVDAEFEDGPSA